MTDNFNRSHFVTPESLDVQFRDGFEYRPARLTAGIDDEVGVILVEMPPGSGEKIAINGLLRFRAADYSLRRRPNEPIPTVEVESRYDGHEAVLTVFDLIPASH